MGALYQFMVRKPDRIAEIDRVVAGEIQRFPSDGWAGVWIVLLLIGPAFILTVVEILLCIRDLGNDLIKIGLQKILQLSGNAFCIACGGKIGYQNIGGAILGLTGGRSLLGSFTLPIGIRSALGAGEDCSSGPVSEEDFENRRL